MVERPGRRFTFEGREHVAAPGETLLEALARDGLPNLQRSPRYHRPRAPLCGLGHCTGCLVRVNGRPNVRACRYEPGDGDRVATRNGWPTRRLDLLAAFDLLFPSGIDTVHGFRRPAGARRLYQAVVRRLAGFDVPPVPDPAAPPPAPPTIRTAEVVVVGGGRAGRAVAERLVAGGRSPLVIERGRSVEPVPGAETLAATTATFLPPPTGAADAPFTLLGFTEPAQGLLVRAREVVVAVGSYDAALLFGSNDRPGVLTADGAFALDRPGATPPFRAAVVFGAGARAREVVDRMGDRVEALVAPGPVPPELVRAASDAGIEIYPRSLLVEAHGRRRVRAVDLRARGTGSTTRIACDAVVLAHRRLPHVPILFQAGAAMRWRPEPGAYFPVAGADGRTSVPGLWVAGSVVHPDRESAADGVRVARHILGEPAADGGGAPDPPAAEAGGMEGYYRELLRLPRRGRWVACPCEDVLLGELEAVPRRGYRGIEVAKRYSGLGTGLCQGRYCLPDALLVLSILEGRPPSEVGYITQRPPVVPTPLSALAAIDPALPPEAPT